MPSALAAIAGGIGRRRIEIDQRLSAHAAIFHKAEAQHIDACANGNIGGVAPNRSNCIRKTRAIHMKAEAA